MEKQEFEELKIKNLSISSANLSNNMEIIYYESKDTLKEEFLYGIPKDVVYLV